MMKRALSMSSFSDRKGKMDAHLRTSSSSGTSMRRGSRSRASSMAFAPRAFVDTSAIVTESHARARRSFVNALGDRRQSQGVMRVNHELDLEMESLFTNIVRKRTSLKTETFPLFQVSADGERLEQIEGRSAPAEASARYFQAMSPVCELCNSRIAAGDLVRSMVTCCSSWQHASCLRTMGKAHCADCGRAILSKQEMKELTDDLL
mmetsp:Transcript_97010/g.182427  ORF Transcript_97010/g.182427 Transcript_97010/m.182427 type:complete len:206 (-) Transcript_97010:83-700(-)